MKHLVSLIILAAPFAAAATPNLPNFQKVNDSLYRGGQPTANGFNTLAALGVKTVIDLREPGEHSERQEQALVEAKGMRYVSVPLKGMSAPPGPEVAQVLAVLNDPSAGPVFIHCRRGADRTGTIIACYRISHDHWNNRDALTEARSLGMRFFEVSMQKYVMGYEASPRLEASAQ
jgi:tyrosine-protein phosphatase SIW14